MRTLFAWALALLCGCATGSRGARSLPPLEGEGEIHVYVEPVPAGALRIAFTLQSVGAVAADGRVAPLQLVGSEISPSTALRQRLLAWGRVAPGTYSRVVLQVKRATIPGGDAPDLLVSTEPLSIAVRLEVARGRASVLLLSLLHPEGSFEFAPEFTAAPATRTAPELSGYCSNAGAASLTVFDKLKREATAVLPTGFEPHGLALDARQNKLYVALAGEDSVAVLDRITGEDLGRIRGRPGDRPRELALSPAGQTLLAIDRDATALSFLDPGSLSEVGRVRTGEDPASLVVDRSGRRAYVFNRLAGSITIVDLAGKAVVATVRTDPEPLRGDLNRAGTRLYVVHGATAYLSVFSVPDLTLVSRLFVGLGASAVKVDPRTDLFYVAYRDDNRVHVYEPMLQLPVASIELPGGAARMTIADAENALVLLLPDQRAVAFVDLTTRKLLSVLDVGPGPYQVVVAGER